jgi:hypothetical protein
MDFVMVAEIAVVAIFPNVAAVGVEERVITAAIRELDTGITALRQSGLGLNEWLQYEHRKKQGDDREDRLCVKVNAHVSASNFSPRIAGRPEESILEADSGIVAESSVSTGGPGGPPYKNYVALG